MHPSIATKPRLRYPRRPTPEREQGGEEPDEEELPCVCELTDKEGKKCGARFADFRALTTRQTSSKTEGRGLRRLPAALTVTSQRMLRGAFFE